MVPNSFLDTFTAAYPVQPAAVCASCTRYILLFEAEVRTMSRHISVDQTRRYNKLSTRMRPLAWLQLTVEWGRWHVQKCAYSSVSAMGSSKTPAIDRKREITVFVAHICECSALLLFCECSALLLFCECSALLLLCECSALLLFCECSALLLLCEYSALLLLCEYSALLLFCECSALLLLCECSALLLSAASNVASGRDWFPNPKFYKYIIRLLHLFFWQCVLSNLTCKWSVVLGILLLLFEVWCWVDVAAGQRPFRRVNVFVR